MNRVMMAAAVLILSAGSLIGETEEQRNVQHPAPSAQRPGDAAALTLDACVALALEAAAERGVFDAEAIARPTLRAARARSLPHLNVTPELRYFTTDADMETAVWGDLGQHVLDIPQNTMHRRMAQRQARRVELHVRRLRCMRAAAAARAYIDVVSAVRRRELARLRRDRARAVHAAWTAVTNETEKIRDRTQRAARAAERTTAEHQEAEAVYTRQRRGLAALCGLPADTLGELAELPAYTLPDASLEQGAAWAVSNRSDLAVARLDVRLTEMMAGLQRLERLPTPGLSFGYTEANDGKTDIREDLFREDEDRGGVFAAVQVRIPIWDAGENAARVAKLREQARAMAYETEEREAGVAADVTAKFTALNAAWQDLLDARADPEPQRAFSEAEIRFAQGGLARQAYEDARLRLAAHRNTVALRNAACHRAEADLLETLEATRAEWRGGL